MVAAAVVAALGIVLVFLYVRSADARAQEQFETVDVLTATAQIEAGETIEAAAAAGKLDLRPVTQAQLLPGYQTTTEGLAGQVALTTIFPGEQIIATKFGATAVVTSALQIPDDKLAISVNLTDPARVAGFVNPGSEVAVFVSAADVTTGQPMTTLLLERVTVIGVGSTTPVTTTTTTQDGSSTTEQLPRTLLTLALSQEEAQKVIYASKNGELAFGLLTDQSAVAKGQPVTPDTLLR